MNKLTPIEQLQLTVLRNTEQKLMDIINVFGPSSNLWMQRGTTKTRAPIVVNCQRALDAVRNEILDFGPMEAKK